MSDAIKSKGVSLAAIFAPYEAGTIKARASGIDDAGTDTSNLYANIIYGSAAAATGIQSESADLNTLYAKIGTASYPLPFDGTTITARSDKALNPNTNTSATFNINSDGTFTVNVIQNEPPGNYISSSGTWLPSADSSSQYQVEFVWNETSHYIGGPATVVNGASTYQACTSNHALSITQNVPTGGDAGSVGTVTINLKKIATGAVTTTVCTANVECFNSA